MQLSSGSGVVHKINLNTLNVTDLTYTVGSNENGSYDIAIGSEGTGLFTAVYSGSGWVRLYGLDTSTDIITVRSDIPGHSTINDDVRLVRSYDRGTILLIGNNSDGWVAMYDAASDSFVRQYGFGDYLYQSPVALNHNGSMAAIQLDGHCRIVDSNFDMVMGLDDSRMGAAFDPYGNLFYQFNYKQGTLFVLDTIVWELSHYVSSGQITKTYQKFSSGETAITGDGRVLGITDPNYVVLYHRENFAVALPGRTIGGLDFGNKAKLCGDIDVDGDVDFSDLGYLCDDWLRYEISIDIAPVVRDYFVNMLDFARFANSWLSRKGDANWDALCDVAPEGGDGFVDFEDLQELAKEWLLEGIRHDSDIAGADGYVNFEDFACLAGNWGIAENIIEYDEDFETGDFSKLPWVHGGDGPWIIDPFEYFEGSYSARSADLPAWKDESILSVTTTCGEGNISFMVRVGADGDFQFRIDGAPMYNWTSFYDGGLLEWSLISIPVSAGTHTFEWFAYPGVGDDFAWIDAIHFPPTNN
jgi:hypothetical protein